jgi:hypothetical protein
MHDLFAESGQPAHSRRHAVHVMHGNSVESFCAGRGKLTGRAKAVFDFVRDHGPVSDRAVMVGLGFVDPNCVRPAITHLVQAGRLAEVGSTNDPATNRHVRLVAVARHREKQDVTEEPFEDVA